MGWFIKNQALSVLWTIFVPAWGWVGSKTYLSEFLKNYPFSSPLGDGLVPTTRRQIGWFLKVFVPEWGWVGS